MQEDGRTVHLAHEAPIRLTRRDFVRKLSAATAGGGLITAAFAGCALTRSQRAEATEPMADQLGKVPKVKLSQRLGQMEISRIVMCKDNTAAVTTHPPAAARILV